MTTAYATSLVGRPATSAEHGAADGAPGLLHRVAAYLAYRRGLAELRALSRADLAELGISRFALPGIARDAAGIR